MKYKYIHVIQQFYGYWEDVEEYDKQEFEECHRVAREYSLLGYPVRIINRRIINENIFSYDSNLK